MISSRRAAIAAPLGPSLLLFVEFRPHGGARHQPFGPEEHYENEDQPENQEMKVRKVDALQKGEVQFVAEGVRPIRRLRQHKKIEDGDDDAAEQNADEVSET